MSSSFGIDRARSSISRFNKIEDLSEILPGLYLGGLHSVNDLNRLKAMKISHIVSVHKNTQPIPDPYFDCKCIQVSDTVGEDLFKFFDEVIIFVQLARVSNEGVLIHCLAGVSRSATLVIAYLMTIFEENLDTCLSFVLYMRSCINPNWGFLNQLSEFEQNQRTKTKKLLYSLFPKSKKLLKRDSLIFTEFKRDHYSLNNRSTKSLNKPNVYNSASLCGSVPSIITTTLDASTIINNKSDMGNPSPMSSSSNSSSLASDNNPTNKKEQLSSPPPLQQSVLFSSSTTRPFVLDLASGRRKIFSTRVASMDARASNSAGDTNIKNKKNNTITTCANTTASSRLQSTNNNSLNLKKNPYEQEKMQSSQLKPTYCSNPQEDLDNFNDKNNDGKPNQLNIFNSNNEYTSKDSAFATNTSIFFASDNSQNLSGVVNRVQFKSSDDKKSKSEYPISHQNLASLRSINEKIVDTDDYKVNNCLKINSFLNKNIPTTNSNVYFSIVEKNNSASNTERKLSLNDIALSCVSSNIDFGQNYDINSTKSNLSRFSLNDGQLLDPSKSAKITATSNPAKNSNINRNNENKQQSNRSADKSTLILLKDNNTIYENVDNIATDQNSVSPGTKSCQIAESNQSLITNILKSKNIINIAANQPTQNIAKVDAFSDYLSKAAVEFERQFSRTSYSISSCKSEDISHSDDNIFTNNE